MAEQVLDDMERMLDFRAHARFEMLKLFGHAAQPVLRQRLALAALHGHVPSYRFADADCPTAWPRQSLQGNGRGVSASSWRRTRGRKNSFA